MQSVLNKKEELCEELEQYQYEESGMLVVKHPLVFSIPHSKEINHFINLQLENKLKLLEKYINENKWSSAMMLYEKPYRVKFIHANMNDIPDDQYWPILRDTWIMTEYLYIDKDIWLELLNSDKKYKDTFMSKEDLQSFNNLPDAFMVYRGYQDEDFKDGMSYTLSLDIAKFFANRFNNRGKIKEIIVNKKDVYAYTNDRKEQEIIITKDLENLKYEYIYTT